MLSNLFTPCVTFLVCQAHGMNILKMLYQDTSLGTHTLQYAGNGLILAISGFASPSWAIRNAATQLFGTVTLKC